MQRPSAGLPSHGGLWPGGLWPGWRQACGRGLWARPVFSQEAVCGGFCLSWPVTPGREGQVCTGAPVAHWLRPGCCRPQTLHRPRPQRSRGGLPTAVPVPVAFQSLSVCPPSHRVPLPSGSAQGLVLACWPPDRGRAGASSTSMRLGGPWGAPGPCAVLVGRPWAGCGFAVDAGRSDSATCPGPGQLDSRSSRPCPFPREGGGRPAFPGAAVLATPQRGAGRRAGRRAHLCPSPHPAAGAAAHQSP